jgi:multicomponent Na+:H+ antiporter subunit F
MICVVALMIGESYLTDVAMLYALISFLAVVVLCKVYMGVFLERRVKEQKDKRHA